MGLAKGTWKHLRNRMNSRDVRTMHVPLSTLNLAASHLLLIEIRYNLKLLKCYEEQRRTTLRVLSYLRIQVATRDRACFLSVFVKVTGADI